MGDIDVERFEPVPDPELFCPICHSVLHKPYETPCQHVFCKECIYTWVRRGRGSSADRGNKCPSCRDYIFQDELKPALTILCNLINKLKVKCVNRAAGCKEIIAKEYIARHERECDYSTVRCGNVGCTVTMMKKDHTYHSYSCPMRLVECTINCQLQMPHYKHQHHSCLEELKQELKERYLEIAVLKETIATSARFVEDAFSIKTDFKLESLRISLQRAAHMSTHRENHLDLSPGESLILERLLLARRARDINLHTPQYEDEPLVFNGEPDINANHEVDVDEVSGDNDSHEESADEGDQNSDGHSVSVDDNDEDDADHTDEEEDENHDRDTDDADSHDQFSEDDLDDDDNRNDDHDYDGSDEHGSDDNNFDAHDSCNESYSDAADTDSGHNDGEDNSDGYSQEENSNSESHQRSVINQDEGAGNGTMLSSNEHSETNSESVVISDEDDDNCSSDVNSNDFRRTQDSGLGVSSVSSLQSLGSTQFSTRREPNIDDASDNESSRFHQRPVDDEDSLDGSLRSAGSLHSSDHDTECDPDPEERSEYADSDVTPDTMSNDHKVKTEDQVNVLESEEEMLDTDEISYTEESPYESEAEMTKSCRVDRNTNLWNGTELSDSESDLQSADTPGSVEVDDVGVIDISDDDGDDDDDAEEEESEDEPDEEKAKAAGKKTVNSFSDPAHDSQPTRNISPRVKCAERPRETCSEESPEQDCRESEAEDVVYLRDSDCAPMRRTDLNRCKRQTKTRQKLKHNTSKPCSEFPKSISEASAEEDCSEGESCDSSDDSLQITHVENKPGHQLTSDGPPNQKLVATDVNTQMESVSVKIEQPTTESVIRLGIKRKKFSKSTRDTKKAKMINQKIQV